MAKSSLDKIPVPLVRNFDDLMSANWEGKLYHVNNPRLGLG